MSTTYSYRKTIHKYVNVSTANYDTQQTEALSKWYSIIKNSVKPSKTNHLRSWIYDII